MWVKATILVYVLCERDSVHCIVPLRNLIFQTFLKSIPMCILDCVTSGNKLQDRSVSCALLGNPEVDVQYKT